MIDSEHWMDVVYSECRFMTTFKHHQMHKTCNSCFGSKESQFCCLSTKTDWHVSLVLNCFRLTKGHVTFFQSKIIVGISLPLMALIKISQSSLLNISFQGVLLHIQNAIGIFLLCVKYCLNKTRQSFSTLIAKQINKYFMNFEIQFKIISKHIIQNFLWIMRNVNLLLIYVKC